MLRKMSTPKRSANGPKSCHATAHPATRSSATRRDGALLRDAARRGHGALRACAEWPRPERTFLKRGAFGRASLQMLRSLTVKSVGSPLFTSLSSSLSQSKSHRICHAARSGPPAVPPSALLPRAAKRRRRGPTCKEASAAHVRWLARTLRSFVDSITAASSKSAAARSALNCSSSVVLLSICTWRRHDACTSALTRRPPTPPPPVPRAPQWAG